MKKILIFFLAVFASIGLISCSSGEKEKPKQEVKQQESSTVEKTDDKKDTQEQTTKAVFNIIDIADKNKEEVDKVLGNPTSTEEAKFRYAGTETYADNCSKAYYSKDNLEVEVMFIEGVAGRITITPKESKDEASMLQEIGIKDATSTGLYNVKAFNPGSPGAYTYVITNEKYK